MWGLQMDLKHAKAKEINLPDNLSEKKLKACKKMYFLLYKGKY